MAVIEFMYDVLKASFCCTLDFFFCLSHCPNSNMISVFSKEDEAYLLLLGEDLVRHNLRCQTDECLGKGS